MRWSAASRAIRGWCGSARLEMGGARAGAFVVLMNPVFLPYGALLNAVFSPVATQFVRSAT